MLGGLLAGSVVIENVFTLPGLGNLLVSAIDSQGIVVQSVAFVILLMVLALNFLMDIAYGRTGSKNP